MDDLRFRRNLNCSVVSHRHPGRRCSAQKVKGRLTPLRPKGRKVDAVLNGGMIGKIGENHSTPRMAHQDCVATDSLQGGLDRGDICVQVAEVTRSGSGTGQVQRFDAMTVSSQHRGRLRPNPALAEPTMYKHERGHSLSLRFRQGGAQAPRSCPFSPTYADTTRLIKGFASATARDATGRLAQFGSRSMFRRPCIGRTGSVDLSAAVVRYLEVFDGEETGPDDCGESVPAGW